MFRHIQLTKQNKFGQRKPLINNKKLKTSTELVYSCRFVLTAVKCLNQVNMNVSPAIPFKRVSLGGEPLSKRRATSAITHGNPISSVSNEKSEQKVQNWQKDLLELEKQMFELKKRKTQLECYNLTLQNMNMEKKLGILGFSFCICLNIKPFLNS